MLVSSVGEPAVGDPVAAGTYELPDVAAPIRPAQPARPPKTAAPVVRMPCATDVRACVDLRHRLSWLVRDGRVVRGPVPITVGSAAEPTPPGRFQVAWKDEVHTSSQYGDPMPYSVFFAAGGIAFHQGSLTQSSHGCVHLSPADAAAYFDFLRVGDAVQVV